MDTQIYNLHHLNIFLNFSVRRNLWSLALWKLLIKEIISDKVKFQELLQDVTIKQEAKLHRFLQTLNNEKKCLSNVCYKFIYPYGSAPVKIYGTPKMHNLTDSDSFPKLPPIVSF